MSATRRYLWDARAGVAVRLVRAEGGSYFQPDKILQCIEEARALRSEEGKSYVEGTRRQQVCFLSDNFVTLIWKLHSGSILAIYICIDNGIKFVNKDLTAYYERVGIFHQKTVPRTPQKNGVVERRNCTLVEAARTMLIFSKAPMTRSYVSDAWTDKFRARTKSGSYSTLCTPTNKELEILFQPMFDEYLEPPRVERPVSPAPAVPILVNSAGTPSSTTIDQNAPSPSHSPSSSALQSLSIHQGVAAESTLMEENPFTPVDNDSFINIFAPKPTSEASSSGDVSSAESTCHLNTSSSQKMEQGSPA
ncbi:retrovirus-related pol polyprotein from transposon TNT 1-94 [Tanacetum coccineum]